MVVEEEPCIYTPQNESYQEAFPLKLDEHIYWQKYSPHRNNDDNTLFATQKLLPQAHEEPEEPKDYPQKQKALSIRLKSILCTA